MPTLKVRTPPLHAGQEAVRADTSRFKVLRAGRRWGKTVLAAIMCIEVALDTGGESNFPGVIRGGRMEITLAQQFFNIGNILVTYFFGDIVDIRHHCAGDQKNQQERAFLQP